MSGAVGPREERASAHAAGPADAIAPDGRLARLAQMRWRLVGAALALAFYALLWLLVAAGATALAGPLVTVPVIALLIAGGNWLHHWLGITRTPPRFASPARDGEEDGTGP